MRRSIGITLTFWRSCDKMAISVKPLVIKQENYKRKRCINIKYSISHSFVPYVVSIQKWVPIKFDNLNL